MTFLYAVFMAIAQAIYGKDRTMRDYGANPERDEAREPFGDSERELAETLAAVSDYIERHNGSITGRKVA